MPAEDFHAVIHPRIGVGPIRFGATAEDVATILGLPADWLRDDNGDQLALYPAAGIAFFAFDPDENMRLVSYEVEAASDAELWGLRIFQVARDVVVRASAAQGLRLQQTRPDVSEDETLFQVRSQSLDFYYEGARLLALTAGVGFTDDDSIEWPAAP